MNWKELRDLIDDLTEEQQATDVTILDAEGEFFKCESFGCTVDDDVLDPDHPFINVLESNIEEIE